MSQRKYLQLLAVVIIAFFSSNIYSQETSPRLDVVTLTSNLGIPWGMAILPDNTMLISQRQGILTKLDLNSGQKILITGLPQIRVRGQGGLFDIALSPNYASTAWIYFSYCKGIQGKGATTLSRAKLSGSRLIELQDLLITQSATNTNVHYGGRISFDDNGHLFLSVGDRGVRSNAQNLKNHAGSILRINLDGTIPKDNPYVDNPNVLSEIWSHGHRNPQGLFFNLKTQQLWAIEHGPRGGDEINLIQSGLNYGWPIISYGLEYNKNIPVGQAKSKEGMQQAIKTYVPSIAPSSLIQYSGDAIPEWQNNLLSGSLKLRHLNRVSLDSENNALNESRLLRGVNGRIRNIIEDDNGWLYLSTDDGRIVRVRPK